MHSIILIEGKYNVNCTFDTSIIVQAYNRDRETPHDVSPPTPPDIRVTYHGGSNLFKFHLAASSGSPKFLKYLFGSAR